MGICKSRITEFLINRSRAMPQDITTGLDGNLWFADGGFVGRVTLTGVTSEFDSLDDADRNLGATSTVYQLGPGPDGNVWFTSVASTGNAYVSSIDSSGKQVHHRYSQSAPQPSGIASGPDGNVWFAERISSPSSAPAAIYLCTPDGAITPKMLPTEIEIGDLIVGPDRNIWLSEFGSVGRPLLQMTPAGTVTSYQLPSDVGAKRLAVGGDGNIWFTNFYGPTVGRISLQGVVSQFPLPTPSASAGSIALRTTDNTLWVTETPGSTLARVTPTGVVTEFAISDSAGGITSGPDGNIWFTEPTLGRIARMVPP